MGYYEVNMWQWVIVYILIIVCAVVLLKSIASKLRKDAFKCSEDGCKNCPLYSSGIVKNSKDCEFRDEGQGDDKVL